MQVEIGLPVRFNKIHFHCPSPEIAAECARQLAESGIPIKKPASDGVDGVDGVAVHSSMDQTWMKIPIGSSGYVQGCLKKKLFELSELVNLLKDMPARHEAFSILRSCASNCKIVHLCRALPPRDSIPTQFDSILWKGFESILGHELEERWWRIARLPVKFGGVGLRSGVTTAAAQYAMSVMKTEDHVKDIAGQDYDAKTVLERDAKEALEKALGEKEGEMATVDLDELLENGGRAKVDNLDLSLSQRCEAAEFNRIFEKMSRDEKGHSERPTTG